jgi:hypothetical protein
MPFDWLCFGVASLEAAFIYYHAALFLSTTFFNFFLVLFGGRLRFLRSIYSMLLSCAATLSLLSQSLMPFAARQLLYYITGFCLPQPTLISIFLCVCDLFPFLCFMLCFISVLFYMLHCDSKKERLPRHCAPRNNM